jgi:hypothetical protein
MSPRVVAGTASKSLADAIAARLGVAPAPAVVERFPDVTPAAGATSAPLLADAIARLHCGRAVGEVLAPA